MGKIKKRIKFVYYGLLCQLLGAPNNNSVFRGKLAQMLPGNKNSAVRLIINGKVTKVGFRRWIRNIAAEHNVDCWAKNKSRDTVEVFLVGRKTRVGKVVKAAYQGPKRAVVERVQERWYNKPLSPTQDVRTKYVITFGGDTSLGEYYIGKTKDENLKRRLHKDPYSFFESLEPIVKDSDYLILNFESVLAEAAPASFYPDKQYPNWDHAERTLGVFNKLGVSAVSLANNHTMDFGPTYLLQTRDLFESKGIKCFGAGQNLKEAAAPLELRLKGNRSCQKVFVFSGMRAGKRYREYGFFAEKESPGVFSVGTRMLKAIKECRKKNPDAIIIVTPHWQGCDYKHVSPKIKDKCRALIDAGADYVIGHGPHMLNEIERWGDGLIAYSIGNFVFNAPGRYGKLSVPPYSLIAKVIITETETGWATNLMFYPIMSDNKKTGFNVQPLDSRTAKDFQGEIGELRKDNTGYYYLHGISTRVKMDAVDNDVLNYVIGKKKLSEIDFNDVETIEKQIRDIKEFHDLVDRRMKDYYFHLLRSKVLKGLTEQNYSYFKDIGEVIRKEHVSYKMLRNISRRKLHFGKAASFRDIIVENAESRRLGNIDYGAKLDSKLKAYEFADRIGLKRPETHDRLYKFCEIPPQKGPVVIKPVASTGSMGVYLIFNENTILSAREGVYLTSWAEVVEDVKKKMEEDEKRVRKYFKKDQWIIEELVVNPNCPTEPGIDLKFYCFYGEVALVTETNRAYYGKYRWYDSDMNLVKPGQYDSAEHFYEDGIGFTKEELDIVIKASLEMPTPHMRIDMLKGANGFYFGEATFYPGTFAGFSKEWDRRLGEAYRRAEARLLADLLNGKEFKAYKEVFGDLFAS